ncbi:MAG: cytochrome c biosis protein transrane region [Firmicutes bacterium]|nr:cytochrome c biosis protein transrane region [Bacillota bacterium]
MDNNITLITAFIAGVISFLSPCVLPVLPTYTAFLAGTKTTDVMESKWGFLLNALCFLSGFTIVFVVMGATASYFGQVFLDYQDVIRQSGAVFMVIMGFHLLGFLEITALQREYRPLLTNTLHGPIGAFILGVAFTTGWTPCIGPILTSILVYASTTATLGQGALLLFVYAMGFCIPFLIVAFLLNKYLYKVRRLYKWLPFVQQSSGVVLIVAGIILYFDLMQKVLGVVYTVYN